VSPGAPLSCGIESPQKRPSGIRNEPPLAEHEPPVIGLEPASLEYGLHRAQYDSLARELEEVGFRVRLNSRRTAYQGTIALGTFYDLVIRLSADSDTNLDALIEHIQHLLSSDKLPPTPRMGKVMLDDGTEYAFPLDEADAR
jgi:hypothetical protein